MEVFFCYLRIALPHGLNDEQPSEDVGSGVTGYAGWVDTSGIHSLGLVLGTVLQKYGIHVHLLEGLVENILKRLHTIIMVEMHTLTYELDHAYMLFKHLILSLSLPFLR